MSTKSSNMILIVLRPFLTKVLLILLCTNAIQLVIKNTKNNLFKARSNRLGGWGGANYRCRCYVEQNYANERISLCCHNCCTGNGSVITVVYLCHMVYLWCLQKNIPALPGMIVFWVCGMDFGSVLVTVFSSNQILTFPSRMFTWMLYHFHPLIQNSGSLFGGYCGICWWWQVSV